MVTLSLPVHSMAEVLSVTKALTPSIKVYLTSNCRCLLPIGFAQYLYMCTYANDRGVAIIDTHGCRLRGILPRIGPVLFVIFFRRRGDT